MALRAPFCFGFSVLCHVCLFGTHLTKVSCNSTDTLPSTETSLASSISFLSTMTIYNLHQTSIVTSTVGLAEGPSMLSYTSVTQSESSYSSNYELSVTSAKPESKVYLSETPTFGLSHTLSDAQSSAEVEGLTQSQYELDTSMPASLYPQTVGTLTMMVSATAFMLDSESSSLSPYTKTDPLVPTRTDIKTISTETINTPSLLVTMSQTVLTTDTVESSSFSVFITPASSYSQGMTTSHVPATSSVLSSSTAEPRSTTQRTGNDLSTGTEVQETTSAEQTGEFRSTMLFVGVSLSCGAGIIIVITIIICRCRAHREGHDLEPLENTEEILEPNSISPLQTTEITNDEAPVDLTRVENIPINVCRPPPPPPPPIMHEPNDVDAEDIMLDAGQGQIKRNHGDENDEPPRRDYWSYHDNGNIPMRTFKGSARVKAKTQSWAPTASVDWEDGETIQPENVARSWGSKEALI